MTPYAAKLIAGGDDDLTLLVDLVGRHEVDPGSPMLRDRMNDLERQDFRAAGPLREGEIVMTERRNFGATSVRAR
jgi:hypothetical protein